MQQQHVEFLKQLYRLQRSLQQFRISEEIEHIDYVVLSTIRNALQGEESMRGIGAAALSRELMVSRPFVSKLLKLYEQQGLVQRSTDPEDHRGICICLTEAGERLLEQADRNYEAHLDWTLERLGEDSVELSRIIEKLSVIFEGETVNRGGNRI